MNDLAQIQTIDDYFREFCERRRNHTPRAAATLGLWPHPRDAT